MKLNGNNIMTSEKVSNFTFKKVLLSADSKIPNTDTFDNTSSRN